MGTFTVSFNNIGQWFYQNFNNFMLMIAVLALGYVLAKITTAYTKKICQKLKIKQIYANMIVQSSYWICLILAGIIALNILITKILGFTTVWLTAGVFVILKAILVFIIGSAIISLIAKMLYKVLAASTVDITLHPFLVSALKVVSFILLCIICIDILGIPTASVVTAMASVGLALSLSVKDHLSNLIGGIVILITKPFKRGDYIEIDDVGGLVDEIGLIYTTLKTFDNKNIYIPNNDAASAKIINHSKETLRRLDLVFSIGYNSDYDKARLLIIKIAEATGFVKTDPAPIVRMSGHAADAIEISCKLWVEWDNFYELSACMYENVKKEFDENNISIPFRQMDLHIIEKNQAENISKSPF